ncbi:MAG TPA: glycosyltransferase, partial [Gammaproteobacteria bacterium]|nr:glycosyltransferase [Gammaproteobacteria bacterium]
GLAAHGVKVDFLVQTRSGPFLDRLPESVRVVELGREPEQILQALAHFLQQERPAWLISAKLKDDQLAATARRLAKASTRLIFRVGNPLAHRLRSKSRNPLHRWLMARRLRRLYAQADAYIAVSQGIADDLTQDLRVPAEKIWVLPNPTVTSELFEAAQRHPGHPWLAVGQPPVILAVGGLRQQKDFPTLVRAFARLRRDRECRLIILGDGRQGTSLLKLAARLGVAEDVDLPGWVENPFAYMARAAVFVLSSRWEGICNVLIEAAALGTPVVATDCISGPREILQGGRFGRLTPVGDARAMAAAIEAVLADPPAAEHTRQAALPFHAQNSLRAYLDALDLHPAHNV